MGPALLESLFHSASHAFLVADASNGQIIELNQTAEQLTGFSRSELLQMSLADLRLPAEREKQGNAVLSSDIAARMAPARFQLLCKDARVVTVECMESRSELDGRLLLLQILHPIENGAASGQPESTEWRNQQIADFAPIALLVHSQGHLVFANATAVQTLGGRAAADLIGRPVIDFVHAEEQSGVTFRMRRVLEDHEAFGPIEERLVRTDGTIFMAEVSATHVEWQGQSSVMVAFRDVSDRVRQRRYREALLRTLQNVLHNFETPALLQEIADTFTERLEAAAVCIGLKEGNSLRVKAVTKEAQELSRHLDGSPVAEDATPCARTILLEAPQLVEDLSLAPFREETMALFRQAGLRSCWSFPIQDQAKHTIGGFTVYFHNRRLPGEEETSLLQHGSYLASVFVEKGTLLDENDRLSCVARQTRDGVVLTDIKHRVTWVNESFTQLTGYTLDEVRGRNLRPILQGPATSSATIAAMKERLAAQAGYQCRIFNYRKDGRTFWNDLRIDPMLDRSGSLVGFIGLQSDATEDVDRQARLEQALAKAEEASRSRSGFFSSVSHEIRTPLNSILGITHLLLDRDPRPDQKDDIVLLQESASRLHSLISNILDYGRLEAGNIPLAKAPFSIAELARQLEEAFGPSFTARGLSLKVEVDRDIPPTLLGDADHIRQMIQNLLANAVKFTTQGGARLTFHLSSADAQSVDLEITVADTGEGIPPSALPHIFEPYFQADKSLTRKHSGTGLGLAITKRILDLYGSRMDVTSFPGDGSTFRFHLRLDRASTELQAPVLHDLTELHGFRILIVEDYEANTLITRKFLELWNLIVDQAHNGEEAVYKARHGGYDLILMDLHMPVMDGYEASRRIREFNPDIPIIALTASDQQEIPERIRQAGMNDLIIKPFRPADLNRKISRFLKSKDQH